LADAFGNRLALAPETSLLLLALHREDRVSLSELTLMALSNGRDAERLTRINDGIQRALDGSTPASAEDVVDRRLPVFARRRWGRLAVIRDAEELHKSGRLRVRVRRRELGPLYRLADSYGNRLTLTEGAARLLLSFHKDGRVDLASLVGRAAGQGANTILLRQLNQELVDRAKIESA
jgi:hypothetical protein